MARPKKQSEAVEPVAINGVFHTAVKHSHLLYEAIEITVKDGMVTEVRSISRAPDLAHAAVANCQREIWYQLRTQTKEAVLGEQA